VTSARVPTVLLTGATGFVGRHVHAALNEAGRPVRVVARPSSVTGLEALDLERLVVTPDLFAESSAWWASTFDGVDTVLHVAWYAEPGRYLTAPENLDCLVGTLAMARGAAAAGVRRFVGIGTCFEYDLTVGRLSVDTPLRPVTPYAAAKAAAFLALSQWLPSQGVELAWCRLFYLYGEGEDSRRLVAHIRMRMEAAEPVDLTSGTQVRDFMDVADAARRIVSVASGAEQGAVNVCSGVPITVRELAERIADGYGRRDLLRFGARPDNLTDPPMVVGVP
jgi:nucleoside-diphosphate-sugar epimerase